MGTRYFTPALFAFLRDLAENNDRDWFKARQDEYERHVREPALDFVTDFAPSLGRLSPYFVADSRKVGGSVFRIQRDTRFSKDKTPYKTHVGIQFRHHRSTDDVHAPGYYLHLEPGGCYAGLGMWHPATEDAGRIRSAIVDRPQQWRRATHGPRFRDVFTLDGDTLKRPPQGFDPEHPLVEDLKRKDFVAGARLTQRSVTSSTFLDDYAAMLANASPFMRFLCDAVGVEF